LNEVNDGGVGDHDTVVCFMTGRYTEGQQRRRDSVTLNYNANDNWNNDGPTATANDKMMYGVIKNNGGNNATAYFYFNNVPQAAYDLYVYTDVNGDGVKIDLSDGLTSYYTTDSISLAALYPGPESESKRHPRYRQLCQIQQRLSYGAGKFTCRPIGPAAATVSASLASN